MAFHRAIERAERSLPRGRRRTRGGARARRVRARDAQVAERPRRRPSQARGHPRRGEPLPSRIGRVRGRGRLQPRPGAGGFAPDRSAVDRFRESIRPGAGTKRAGGAGGQRDPRCLRAVPGSGARGLRDAVGGTRCAARPTGARIGGGPAGRGGRHAGSTATARCWSSIPRASSAANPARSGYGRSNLDRGQGRHRPRSDASRFASRYFSIPVHPGMRFGPQRTRIRTCRACRACRGRHRMEQRPVSIASAPSAPTPILQRLRGAPRPPFNPPA